MGQKYNGTRRVFVVFRDDDLFYISALCVTGSALDKYLQEELSQYKESLKEDPPRSQLKRVESFADEGYQISAVVPEINYTVNRYDIDNSLIETSDSKSVKVRVFYCHFPREIEFFKTEDEAKKWASLQIDKDYGLEGIEVISDIEVLF